MSNRAEDTTPSSGSGAVEAVLAEARPDGSVRCHTCRRRCVIAPDRTGACRMYRNTGGTLYSRNYAQASSVAVDPIEKKPLYHFHPGSQCFSIGGWGCNFQCPGCQNWQIACPADDEPWRQSRTLAPEAAIALAQANRCTGIAWTYNEPTVWFEYTLDCARLAKAAGLYTAYVTNGYLTPEALDLIGPHLDAWRVDLKGFSDTFYRTYTKVADWRGILETTQRARNKWNMHVEVVTNVMPGWNDDDAQLGGIAGWIADALGALTPWHVTRFHPQHALQDVPPTPLETLERACRIGREAGLQFVYCGNVPGHKSETTRCPTCDATIIERTGYTTRIVGLAGASCAACGAEVGVRRT